MRRPGYPQPRSSFPHLYPVQSKMENAVSVLGSSWAGIMCFSKLINKRRTMLLGMSRGHFRASRAWSPTGGCGKTGSGHKGKLLVGQLAPVTRSVGKCVGGGPADQLCAWLRSGHFMLLTRRVR